MTNTASQSFTVELIEELGFVGFDPVESLVRARCMHVPATPGVYVVVRPADSSPRFRSVSEGGWFKGRDPTKPRSLLRSRWVSGTAVLYIGMAGTDLRSRVHALVRYGTGAPVGHQGGQYLWQVQGSRRFLVAWKPVRDARRLEIRLIKDFERAHGQLPFANRQH
jgi:hypothetical protein